MGNSVAVANEHYLRTTDEHFQNAVRKWVEIVTNMQKLLKPAHEKPPVFQGGLVIIDDLQSAQSYPTRTCINENETAIVESINSHRPKYSPKDDDPLLQLLIERWEMLSAKTKQAIIELAENDR